MSDERRPTINIYASRHRGKTAEAKRREEQSERDCEHESSRRVNGGEQLRACPFCGSSAVRLSIPETGWVSPVYVECTCGALGPQHRSLTRARAAWNERIPAKPLAKESSSDE